MNKYFTLLAAAVGIILLGVGYLQAQSEIAGSTSNAPEGGFVLKFEELLAREAKSLNGLQASKLTKISTPVVGLRRSRRNATSDFVYEVDHLPVAKGGQEWRCLTDALYFEARGETVRGQFAVAEVILNRVSSLAFPNTVCKVVGQGAGRKHACQFSFMCDGRPETISEPAAFERAGKIAKLMLDGAPRQLVGGATYYHTTAVSPRWARKFRKTAQLGVHIFYSRS